MKREGFTLVELMVVLAISTFVGLALFMALRFGSEQHDTANTLMTIEENARESLYRMSQELRQSAVDRVTISGDGASVQFEKPDPDDPVNDDFTINWDDAIDIEYALDEDESQLIRTNSGTGEETVIANHVEDILFEWDEVDSTVLTMTIQLSDDLINTRTIPGGEENLQMTAQAEIRNQ